MDKRSFLAVSAFTLPLQVLPRAAEAAPRADAPVLLTVSGQISRSNRAPLDPALDQMLYKHGVRFDKAWAFTAEQLHKLPRQQIKPVLEYDAKAHVLSGPRLVDVLVAAGADTNRALRLNIRAVDGYAVSLTVPELKSLGMLLATHLDGQPLSLGGLGPQWAVFEPESQPAWRGKPLKERFALCPWGVYCLEVNPS